MTEGPPIKAVLHYRASPGFRARLDAAAPPWLRVTIVAENDRASLVRELADTTVLLHVLEPVTADLLAAAPRLLLVQKIGVGVNTIDLDAARAHGVGVANMPGTNTQAVVELTLALMLAALRRLPTLDRSVREGRGWSLDRAMFDGVGELGGRTVGLVGWGAVARRLAPVLVALGATVVYTARRPAPDAVAAWRPLDELLAIADIVSLHVPLTAETAGMLNAAALARMKPGAILVNTARGGLVDERALAEALRTGRVRAAALDVFAEEPPAAGDALVSTDATVLSPHVAWLTPETLDRSLAVAIENCRRLRAGERLLHEVVPPRRRF